MTRLTSTLKRSLARMKKIHGDDCKFRWILGRGIADDILDEFKVIAENAGKPAPKDVSTLWGCPVEVYGPDRQMMLIPA
mgnify:CR=1 FL=1